jgi:hypothetical protein
MRIWWDQAGNPTIRYPDTLNQWLDAQIKPVGSRPLFILEDAENFLAVEQRNGLTAQQAAQFSLLRMARV